MTKRVCWGHVCALEDHLIVPRNGGPQCRPPKYYNPYNMETPKKRPLILETPPFSTSSHVDMVCCVDLLIVNPLPKRQALSRASASVPQDSGNRILDSQLLKSGIFSGTGQFSPKLNPI